ncbi:hypothetical protein GUJ93_ZPchr0015g7001 [Zizania palustris]|uniref:NAC domain-containing protein n=1 Tax=Zizania palustris TaxID=103762 RepID=A0A8J5T933_ZIZPA|nr:hypothetical protein GUJ93_ZPchr0015g6874 [Zizania palustris]KAG8083449.1 hypothetical protein GUJ93_ZPchr0015g7001 [Zizania palustris]
MADRPWIIAGKVIATKIRNATQRLSCKLGELVPEAWRDCPNCKYHIDNSDVTLQWPEFPDGVKFDPSDMELLEHLERKINLENSGPQNLIDYFIPTLEEVEGICYTHPENLPGIKMDGSSSHFFHRISNAYGSGQRKRRKISPNNHADSKENIRWHKTGRSKEIYHNGVKKGWKKILVLYKGYKKRGDKIEQANWVMHQYNLGVEEEEKDGELVLSKVFCQLVSKPIDTPEMDSINEASGAFTVKSDPRTPGTNPPWPRRPMNSPCETEQNGSISHDQDEGESGTSTLRPKVEPENPRSCAATSTVRDLDNEPLLQCNDFVENPSAPPEETLSCLPSTDAFDIDPFSDLDGFILADLQFGSQDSFSWADADHT